MKKTELKQKTRREKKGKEKKKRNDEDVRKKENENEHSSIESFFSIIYSIKRLIIKTRQIFLFNLKTKNVN